MVFSGAIHLLGRDPPEIRGGRLGATKPCKQLPVCWAMPELEFAMPWLRSNKSIKKALL